MHGFFKNGLVSIDFALIPQEVYIPVLAAKDWTNFVWMNTEYDLGLVSFSVYELVSGAVGE